MTTCTQVAVSGLFVLTLTACGGGGGSSEPAQASADPDSTIEWQGDWQVDTSYALNDIVYFEGQAFINVQPTTVSEGPQDTSHWELLVDRGETGPIGPQGIAGADGAAGSTGPAGPQGVAGTDGATGPEGPASLVWQGAYTGGNSYQINDAVSFNGSAYISIQDTTGTEDPSDTSYWELLAERGADGSAGPQAPIGATGNDGAAGPQGVAGADGTAGPTGPAGAQGVAGADGAVGPTGSTGPQGVAGAEGTVGPAGPQGAAGADGATGPAGPASLVWQGAYTGGNSYQINDAVSFNGSAYISIQDTTGTEDPSDISYWELLAERGADGSAGPQGPIGATGNDGAAGSQGVAGADGTAGPTGPAGAQGVAGATGPQGDPGVDAADDPDLAADLLELFARVESLEEQIEPVTYYSLGATGPGGGIVFQLTEDGRNGLEAALVNQSNSAEWCSFDSNIAGVDATTSGANNTPLIEAECGASSAAAIAAAYEWPNGQTDGFLPSRDELDDMYSNLHENGDGNFSDGYYLSSSEANSTGVYAKTFQNWGYEYIRGKQELFRVRAARAF